MHFITEDYLLIHVCMAYVCIYISVYMYVFRNKRLSVNPYVYAL